MISAGFVDPVDRPPEPGRHRRGILELGCAEEQLEGWSVDEGRLLEEGEDAAAAVVGDDDRERQRRQLGADQRGDVVEEGQIADKSDRRSPRADRHTERGRDDAVDSVRAAVGEDVRW